MCMLVLRKWKNTTEEQKSSRSFFNMSFSMSSQNKGRMDSKDQNCRYIVLILKPHWTTSFSAIKCCLIQESELHIITCAPGNKEKKAHRLKDLINQEPLSVFNVSVSICWDASLNRFWTLDLKHNGGKHFRFPASSCNVHLIHNYVM